ncbi:MAG: DNA-directed RNA polymerase subunit beta' [Ignavibacteria bacterium]|jgi:DNA-directed RNA polymerase subunit beta'|nr:DNA-directed RNA polymerase subunit beta' [Ignavibacteria bacterium]MCU7499133.1 DNA-directed RNA polymerase subunit beta' [Ignavibacteria bacterium]MCU7512975.1 DNA-directed RNA polymerase subunit beta' [Ignavibacteria bacterium]MCU7521512.1 DNA-directed RNA polymerase subunit beta' [Ignavibacteria bacterium]MCU7526307.1 DNA-directed RNA polymerase subunit beta' [Ignavibacteria bacterium]
MPYRIQENAMKSINSITIGLASPDDILSRSHGEVTKPETINYRSFRPEKDGLFCEKIFGPIKDWECHCGKYKRIRYKGIVCDRCGVEVTQKAVRRERMGHISLAVPVVHIWFFRALPSKIGNIIGMTTKELEKIIYYESYVVINPGPTGLSPKDLISEDQYFEILYSLPAGNEKLEDTDPKKFVAKIGGDAIKELLKRTDVDGVFKDLREQVKVETSQQKKNDALKRLRVLEAFREKENKVLNKPEWMVLSVIPVIPPELRPLVPLEGGRFATSDLNDLYRRVIIRNNRLKRLIDIKAPEVILRNEKRMLQEAVDALFDNSRRGNAVRSDSNRPLKSLSDMLKGKQGRFRQNLLGKRVDYSGRSVIVVGPELKLHQCGLPKDMAVELFKPFIIRKLIERGHNKTVKSARKVVDRKDPIIWSILEGIIDGHPILLNRAPTLHRLGIQAFQPLLIDGKALQLHPMVCTAFNADFDGDQMAVHVPLSYEAQLEAVLLMLSSHNILSPQNGSPIVVPTQDIVLGCYYLTKVKEGAKGEGLVFGSMEEVLIAYNSKAVDLHARIKVRVDGKMIETTVGRVRFNQIVPKEMGYLNEVLVKKIFSGFIYKLFIKLGNKVTAKFLDDLKELGFRYSTAGGLSVSFADMIVPEEKVKLIQDSNKKVADILNEHEQGVITDAERYNKIIDVWTHTTNNVAKSLMEKLRSDQSGFNSLHMMVDSGARGSQEQVRQLAGMRGLMMKPQKSLTGQSGEIIENPIVANFKEGLSVLEYFISTHGARKGLADTALKTADAGYLTRRLCDVAQDVIVSEDDCGTIRGVAVTALKDVELERESLAERITGRVAQEDVFDPRTDEVIVAAGELITEDIAEVIEDANIDSVYIRTVLTCESKRGVCAKCYGRNLTNGKLVEIGEAVGIIAAQSIGEPGTQLTLRTFHLGGTSSRIASQSQVEASVEGSVQFEKVYYVEKTDFFGKVKVVTGRRGSINLLDKDNRTMKRYEIPYGAELLVDDDQVIKKGAPLYNHDPYNAVILTDIAGRISFVDLVDSVTMQQVTDEQTGHVQKVVIESKDKTLTPSILVTDNDGNKKMFNIPTRSYISVDEGEFVQAGTILAKISKSASKTRDITGGLPRVTELFEARSPHDPATVAEIEGIVKFGARKKGSREIVIIAPDQSYEKVYSVPYGKHILVQEGDEIPVGEKITDGPIDPHDILKIKGTNAVQEYLVNEIQDVYRLQGVKINDKHIEVIVRQMLQKLKIVSSGDTKFIEEDYVDRVEFNEENEKIKSLVYVLEPGSSKFKVGQLVSRNKVRENNAELTRKGKKTVEARDAEPATFEHVLLGITQAALSTDSFISAASFQETTKVLTNAATEAKTDSLIGLKENVVMGHLIPAGTGLKKYKKIILKGEEAEKEKPVEVNTSVS